MFGLRSRRNWDQASKSALLVESHRMCLLLSTVSCETREAIRDSAEIFLCWGGWEGLFTKPPSTLALTKIPDSQKKSRYLAQTILFCTI